MSVRHGGPAQPAVAATVPMIAVKGARSPLIGAGSSPVALKPSHAPRSAPPAAAANPVILIVAGMSRCTHAKWIHRPTDTPTEVTTATGRQYEPLAALR
jgi:hypothetical protein